MEGISFGTVKRLMKESMDKYGIEHGRGYIQISEEAVEKLREAIEKKVRETTKKAVKATKDQGRKMITEKEIELVSEFSEEF